MIGGAYIQPQNDTTGRITHDPMTTLITRVFVRPAATLLAFGAVALTGACAPTRSDGGRESTRPAAVEYYVRGEQAWRAGDKMQAEQEYRAAVQHNPNLRMAQSRLGDINRARGDYQAASRHYEAVARLDPYGVDSHYNLGLTYQFLNRLQDAAASYLRALQLRPTDARANMNLGLVYLALNQFDDAIRYLQRATELQPRWAVAWSNLGVALDARGDVARAEQVYRRSLELDSNSPTTLQNLASNLMTQGKAREAVAVMEQVIGRVDNAATRKRYGDALVQARRFEEGLREYDAALKLDKRFYPAMNEKAFLLIRQYREGLELDAGKRQAAIALWKESLRLNADQPEIRRQLEKAENPQVFGTGNGK
jgi:tetratricopeptide (TPR) repeat protein